MLDLEIEVVIKGSTQAGVIAARRFSQPDGANVEYLVKFTADDGEEHERWFLADNLIVQKGASA